MNYDEFETKDSGQREEYASGMRRDVQTGKPRFDLFIAVGVPYASQLLTRVAGLLSRGADKYGDRNHELASGDEELERFKASALRHLMQYVTGETDEDHAAAVVFNLFAAESLKARREFQETEQRVQETVNRVQFNAPTEEGFARFQEAVKEASKERLKAKEKGLPTREECEICNRTEPKLGTPLNITLEDVWPLGNLTAYDLKNNFGYNNHEAFEAVKKAKAEKKRRYEDTQT